MDQSKPSQTEDQGLLLARAFYREPDGSVYMVELLQDVHPNGGTSNYIYLPDLKGPEDAPEHSFMNVAPRRGKHIELQQLLWDSTRRLNYDTHCSQWSRAVREVDE